MEPGSLDSAELFAAFSRAQSLGKSALLFAGPIGSGKTKTASLLAKILSEKGFPVAGIVSPRILKDGKTLGYVVRDICTGRTRPLCAISPRELLGIAEFSSLFEPSPLEGEVFQFRRFFFSQRALEFGNSVLMEAAGKAEVIVVDEVGPLELSGHGFAPGLRVCRESKAFLILTVRPRLLSAVKRWLELENAEVLSLQGEGQG